MKITLNTKLSRNYHNGMTTIASAKLNSTTKGNSLNNEISLTAYPNSYYLNSFSFGKRDISFGNQFDNYTAWGHVDGKYKEVKLYTDEENEDPIKYARDWNELKRKQEFSILEDAECFNHWFKGKIRVKYKQAWLDEQIRVNSNRMKAMEDDVTITASNKAASEELKKKMGNYAAALEKRNQFKDDTSSVNMAIAGYDHVKNIIADDIIMMDTLEKGGEDAEFPNAIMFYGPIGTGKTLLATTIAEETGFHVENIKPEAVEFQDKIRTIINEARERYNTTKQRTIVVLDEIDALEDTPKNKRNIDLMKSVLNDCSKKPSESNSQFASGTTFFITTNRPLDTTDEILMRKGKLETIPVGPAKKEDIAAIIKHYIKKADPEKKDIDYEKALDYDFWSELMMPDDKDGAFNNIDIKTIVNATVDLYNLNNKTKSFEACFEEILNDSARSILPGRFANFKKEVKMISSDPEFRKEYK